MANSGFIMVDPGFYHREFQQSWLNNSLAAKGVKPLELIHNRTFQPVEQASKPLEGPGWSCRLEAYPSCVHHVHYSEIYLGNENW